MSNTFFRDVTPEESGAAPAAAPGETPLEGDDLQETLAEPESEFIIEEKKPLNKGAMLLFVIFALGAGGTYLMYVRSGPKSASAATVSATDAEVTRFLSDGPKNMAMMKKLLVGAQKFVEQFNHFSEVTQVPLKDLRVNPFLEATPKPPDAVVTEDMARKKREEERQAAMKAVQGLQLQSILRSQSLHQCMINNTLLPEGAEVEGFKIEKVNANSVIVRQGVFRFELKMQK